MIPPFPAWTRVPSFDDYLVFVDESGDHGIETVDPGYPVFVLVFCVFAKDTYAASAAPALMRFKFRHWGHDQVVLHEREIRKPKGPFAFLMNTARRDAFHADLTAMMDDADFRLIASVIRKDAYRARFPAPDNPYHVAMGFGLERVYLELRARGCRDGSTHVICERRGPVEDAQLEAEIRRVCANNATGRTLPFEPVMASKQCNSAGLQMADLVARPIGRKIICPGQENRAFDVIERKFRRDARGRVQGWGLKVYP